MDGVYLSIPSDEYVELLEIKERYEKERKRGRWIDLDNEYTWVKCSLCGNEVVRFDPNNFCPNCGAKMDKE